MLKPPSSSLHVAIVGAGVIGAMSAWRLARRGVRVTLFDRYAPAHDRGAAGGESRIFRIACKEGARHVPLVRESLAMWRELESEADQRLLYQTGVATVGAAHAPGMRAIRETAAEFGLRLEALDRAAASGRFPQFHLAPEEMMLFDPEGGALRADLAVLCAVERAAGLGASLRNYTSVDAVESFDDRVELRSGDTKETFSHVVMAPGGWASFDPALAVLPLVTRRISLGWFAPREPARYDIGHSIVLMHLFESGYFYMFPSMDGATVKGSCNIDGWPAIDAPQALPRSLPPGELAHLCDAAAAVAPGLRRDPVRIGVYMDAYTPDDEGLLGCVPGAKGSRTLVATGFSGHGFKFSPAIGEAVARLIVEGEAGPQVAHLDVARFQGMPASSTR
ncbi:FAD-dependent oxidoreductase [Caballeronia hypogeia]|uniref:FAD-dependent oxidoreductase n=1 Tax=Caballeronia hypogeia TaxID=1777140 RepID=A0A158DMY7_9BURK|nr:FAD-dependent oxidoreductase [Caballeronia hypogeia]SAK95556.1 FAD-dependent oxidoreductase [Caballeronia hypogeia]